MADDVNTSIRIHSRGWTSSYISPDPPAFLGCMPSLGPEAMLQWRRWGTGMLEVFFNKQNPLIGMFHQKMRFRQRLAYLSISMWSLRSIPELLYCLLPAYCLLNNSLLFPKGLCFGITVTLVGMQCLYTLWEFMSLGFSVQSWYVSQSIWRIKATCCWLFSIFDITLKLLGISEIVFTLTKKTMPETWSGSKNKPSQREDDGLNSDSSKFEIDGSICFLPGIFILLVNLVALACFSVGLQLWSRNGGGGGAGLAEVCGCVLVVLLFSPFLKGLFKKGKFGIPWSTLSKAICLVVLFVAFSVRM